MPGFSLMSHQIFDVCKFCSNSQSLMRESIVLMQGGRCLCLKKQRLTGLDPAFTNYKLHSLGKPLNFEL